MNTTAIANQGNTTENFPITEYGVRNPYTLEMETFSDMDSAIDFAANFSKWPKSEVIVIKK